MIVEPVVDFAAAVDEVIGSEDFDGTWFKDIIKSHNITYRLMTVNIEELIEPETSVLAITNGWDQDKILVLWRESQDSSLVRKYLCVVFPDTDREELIHLIAKTMKMKAFL